LFEIGRSWSVLDVDGLVLRDRRGDVVVSPQHFELDDDSFSCLPFKLLRLSRAQEKEQPT
jgi:hypothetical protein